MFYFIAKSFRAFLATSYRNLYCILYARQGNWTCKRFICSLLCGFFFAWLMWWLLMANFLISQELQWIMLGAVMIIIGIGYALTPSIKCITLLIFVAMVGKSGRSYLRALSFAIIIAGPIENLSANGEEVVRVFTCSAILTYNLTKTRLDLMTKPFQNTLAHMKDDIKEVQHTFGEVERVLTPIRSEVEGDADEEEGNDDDVGPAEHEQLTRDASSASSAERAEHIQKKYKAKFAKRCKQQLEKGKQRCREAFSKAHQGCQAKFPRVVKSLLCWPLRVDFVCKMNLLGDPDRLCDPTDAIPSNFGENYADLEATKKDLFDNGSKVKVSYKLHNGTLPPALKDADKTARLVMAEFDKRKRVFDHIMNMMKGFLSFLFIRIIFASVLYYWNYRRKIDFDNLYITDYFKHVDERRKQSGKRNVLPLKQVETAKLVDLSHICSKTKAESKEQFSHLLLFSLEVITACFFLLLDHIIVSLLEIVRLRSEISYVQEGEHTIHFKIEGAGLMARLLRSTLRNFNMHEHVSTYLSNEACLPRPSALPQSFYIKLMAIYAGIVFLIYKSTMFRRLRRFICSYFYRRREKQRVLYLYNNLLKQRRVLFETLLKNAQANVANRKLHKQLNFLLRARLKWPQCCGWLKCVRYARHKCLVCGSLEDEHFTICRSASCGMAYCRECWREMGAVCLVCKMRNENSHTFEFEQYFEVEPISTYTSKN